MDFLEKISTCSAVIREMFDIDNKEEQTPEDKARQTDLLRESIVRIGEFYQHIYTQGPANDMIAGLVNLCKRSVSESNTQIQPTVTLVVETRPPVQPVPQYESKYDYMYDSSTYLRQNESLYRDYCARALDCTTDDEIAELNGTYLKMATFLDDTDYAKHLAKNGELKTDIYDHLVKMEMVNKPQ